MTAAAARGEPRSSLRPTALRSLLSAPRRSGRPGQPRRRRRSGGSGRAPGAAASGGPRGGRAVGRGAGRARVARGALAQRPVPAGERGAAAAMRR